MFCKRLILLLVVGMASQVSGQGMIYPLYERDAGAWQQAAFAAGWLQQNGTDGYRNFVVIANPNSGPGDSQDAGYLPLFANVRNNGGKVIGYVSTSFGNRSLADIRTDIELWIQFYGGQLDGIFLDEWTGHHATDAQLYRDLYWLIKVHYGLELCVANPGTSFANQNPNPDSAWWADIVVIHEQSYANSTNFPIPLWAFTQTHAHKPAMLIHSMPLSQPVLATAAIQSAKARGVKWLFVTDDVLNNPWDSLPGEQSGAPANQWSPYWGNVIWSVGQAR